MIKINNLTKIYDKRKVLENINLSFSNSGMVFITGPSGCGKTTLLNAISGLIKYDGSITFSGIEIENLSEKNMDDFRLSNIGLVFQDYKLFENDNVYNNIAFPLDLLGISNRFNKKQKINDLLSLVGLEHKRKQKIKECSGGEKQRIAIARALANDPKCILADEPTGALDTDNGISIVQLLKSISKKRLVIIVTHDINLAKKYADRIICLNNGNVVSDVDTNESEEVKEIFIIKNEYSNKKHILPLSTLFRHTFSSIKSKKWRTSLCTLVTSLGLVGIGLSSLLTSSIQENITNAYSSLVDGANIVISSNENGIQYMESCSFEEAKLFKTDNEKMIDDIGVIYVKDFSSMFPTKNDFVLQTHENKIKLSNFSFESFNEIRWLDYCDNIFYPSKPQKLNNDDIVLGLNLASIQTICFALKITRSIESLSNFLLANPIQIVVDVANEDWGYDNQEIFTLKAFTLTTKPCIYHYNHCWNEFIFEECFKMSFSYSLNAKDSYPWTLKKFYYFQSISSRDEVLKSVRYNKSYDNFVFEIGTPSFFPLQIDKDYDVSLVDKVLILKNKAKKILPRYIDLFLQSNDAIYSPVIDTGGSYIVSGSNLLVGFSSYSFFSLDKQMLTDNTEHYSTMSNEDIASISSNNNIVVGHYSKTLENAVIFNTIPYDIDNTYSNISDDEIVISSHLFNYLNRSNYDGFLYASFCSKENTFGNNKIVREYKTLPLKIVGIIDSNINAIYHNLDWLVSFFQTRVGISSYSLQINSVSFKIKESYNQIEVMNELKKDFPKYNITSPLYDVTQSVNEVCNYVEVALLCFSAIAMIVSSILLTLSTYTFVFENRKEIGLLRCLGASKHESNKMLIFYCVTLCLLSFIFSCFEIVVVSILSNKAIALTIGSNVSLMINPMCFLYMFAAILFVIIISSICVVVKFRKLSPLQTLLK